MTIEPLSDIMGVEVSDVDLRTPPSAELAQALDAAFEAHAVVCMRSRRLQPEQLLRVAKMFGTPEPQVNKHLMIDGSSRVGVLSSETTDVHGTGKRVINGTTWHTDHSFTAKPPRATLLHAIELPARGGDTSFCNLRAAYDALPQQMRQRIDGLDAVHCYQSSRSPRPMMARTPEEAALTPDVVHPLVRRNPVTGARSLYLSTTRLDRIIGLQRDESDALVDELLTHATQPRFVYHHRWQPGDVVIWDNRCTMHHANADYELCERRLLYRILLEGEIPLPAAARGHI
jgi:taurine dioxygenase